MKLVKFIDMEIIQFGTTMSYNSFKCIGIYSTKH